MFVRRGLQSRDELSGQFAAVLAAASPARPRLLVGAEHEYRVLRRDRAGNERAVDFRGLIHGLKLGRPHLDPDDPYSYRLPSGSAVTCDEAEAEIVLAPRVVGPGSASNLAIAAIQEREALAKRLSAGLELEGHSTHVSVSVDPDLVEDVGRLFALTFGADLMRLVESPDRCGIWVRPRSGGRLELCLDYIDGPRLAGVAAFCVAAVGACVDSVLEGGRFALPPAVKVFPRRPRHRFGWHLAPAAFAGGDPFAPGESAPLTLLSGGAISAESHLIAALVGLDGLLTEHCSSQEVRIVQQVVFRESEGKTQWDATANAAQDANALATVYGDTLVARSRKNFEIGLVGLTWSFGIFLLLIRRTILNRGQRQAFAYVPRANLEAFLKLLDGGVLDELVREYLSADAQIGTTRALERQDQTATAGLFNALGLRRDLVQVDAGLADRRLRLSGNAA